MILCRIWTSNSIYCRINLKILTEKIENGKISLGDLAVIFFLIDFFILCIFYFFKLISLVDHFYIFSIQGSKLDKYIKEKSQQKLTCNLESDLRKNSVMYFIQQLVKSPDYFFKIFIISCAILSIKICITYRYITSNFIYLNVFHKNINLIPIFGEQRILFIFLYYVLSTLFIFSILIKLIKLEKTQEKEYEVEEKKIFLARNFQGQERYLTYRGLYQNILITGSIGTGKTSSAISHILEELIKKDIYGLIIDVKGNYIDTLKKIAGKYGKEKRILEISMDSDFKYNPLNKPELSCSELANYMIRVLKVLSFGNQHSDPFWLEKSESYIRDFITLIRAYNNDHVDFMELHNLVTKDGYLEEKLGILKGRILKNELGEEELFAINIAISNIINEYRKLDERVLSIIKSEITRMTNLFINHYSTYEKFCTSSDKLNFLDSRIVILSFNIGQNRFLSKVISTYLKLDFQQQILSRKKADFPVFFICDEFQEIVNCEDSNFFSISREYQCMNIISMQSYSSLMNALQNEKAAYVIIQNLVNKIWFRNDDMYTVEQIMKQIGKEEKELKTLSYTETGQNSRYSFLSHKFKDYKTGLSKGYSIQNKNEYKINEEDITTNLKTFEAMIFLSNGDEIEKIEKVKFKRWGQ